MLRFQLRVILIKGWKSTANVTRILLIRKTGIGLTDHSLVSVVAPDSMTADSLTKVVSVLGPEKGLRFIERTPGAAARIMRNPLENIEVYESKRFKRFYEKAPHPLKNLKPGE